MHKNGQKRKDYILFTPNGNRKNKGMPSPDHVHEERPSLKKVFSLLLKTSFSLTDKWWRNTQINSEDHSWQIPHQNRSSQQLIYSLCVFLAVYFLFHAWMLSLFLLEQISCGNVWLWALFTSPKSEESDLLVCFVSICL